MDVDVVAANDADPATNATLVATITATAIPSTATTLEHQDFTVDQTKCYSRDSFDPPARKQRKKPTSPGLTATDAHNGIFMCALVPVATLSRTSATSVLKHAS